MPDPTVTTAAMIVSAISAIGIVVMLPTIAVAALRRHRRRALRFIEVTIALTICTSVSAVVVGINTDYASG